MKKDFHAHSENKTGACHLLREHLSAVSRLAGDFSEGFSFHDEASLAGLLHDLGKYGDRFQARLRGEEKGLDHWSQGAWLALQREYQAVAAALAIQGHHIGLQHVDASSLRGLLQHHESLQLDLSGDWQVLNERLKTDGLLPEKPQKTIFNGNLDNGLDRMLDVRMLFSTLVDADFLDTEAHFNGDGQGKCYRKSGQGLHTHKALSILLEHIESLGRKTQAAGTVAQVRQELLAACLNAAGQPTGQFTLTAPTGSGKTLAMLAFALAHAKRYGLRRVIMVIPYLSVIEQTAAIYRSIFEPHFGPDYVLEHHSLAGGGREKHASDNEGAPTSEEAAERRRRLLSENWDAPLIITTSVQMLESLFSNRPSACRKLHRLARSVILFDEVQTLPAPLAVPTLAALSHLAQAYGSSVVFSTATQPAFTHLHDAVKAHCVQGWQPRPIVPEPVKLFDPMKRVNVEWHDPDQAMPWPTLAQRLRASPQSLCIVNLKRHAQTLWEILGDEDIFHLSTSLCPAHRRDVLDVVRARLRDKLSVRLIATQCIEAGVDVDFPEVWRAYGPLDAIIQAAGRCNREGKLNVMGKAHVFTPNDENFPPGGYEQATRVTQMLLRKLGKEGMKLDDPEFITAYYRDLYDIGKPEASKKTRRIEGFIKAGAFPEIAQEFRLIEQDTINIAVPYSNCLEEFRQLREMADGEGLTGEWIRRARALTISLFRPKNDDPVWDSLLQVRSSRQGGRKTSEDWYIALKPEHYHPVLGYQPPKSLSLWIG